MSIEEIIDGLDKLAKKHEVCANCQDLKPIAPVYLKTAQLLRAAIEKLKTHPDNQPNEPLTLEELLEMDGKPVYVQFGDGVEGWVVVGLEEYPDDTPPTVFLYSFDMENEGHCEPDTDFLNLEYSGEFYSNSHFGLHSLGWRAYRRPPKEESA